MKIISKKTKLPHDIDQATWDKIKADGKTSMYIVVDGSEETSDEPESVEVANYKTTTKKAAKLQKDKKYADALELYMRAQKMNDTEFIQKKIAELEDLI